MDYLDLLGEELAEEERKYENIIAKYNDRQLLYEMNIVNNQETAIYNMKKALKQELKKRTGGKK